MIDARNLLRALVAASCSLALPASAQDLGMITDWDTAEVKVFDAGSDTVIGSVQLPTDVAFDCAMLANQSLGFVADHDKKIWVIDLTATPPVLASGTNPITITNLGEDLVITRDQRFLIVSSGAVSTAITVVDIAARMQVSSLSTGADATSVEVTEDGSVLVTAFLGGSFHRFFLDGTGHITDTGESNPIPNGFNSYGSPTGDSGIVVSGGFGIDLLTSFQIPGLATVDQRDVGALALCGVMHPGADLFYVRTDTPAPAVQLWQYDHGTASLGLAPLNSAALPPASGLFFGIESMALHPNRQKLYVSSAAGVVHILDPITLVELGTIGGFTTANAVCFRTTDTPLAVDLESFDIRKLSDQEILLGWTTAAEIDNAGFNVYREPWSADAGAVPAADAVPINSALIPAQGAPTQGSRYRLRDNSVASGEEYLYWLEDIDVYGVTTLHGPIAIR